MTLVCVEILSQIGIELVKRKSKTLRYLESKHWFDDCDQFYPNKKIKLEIK